MNLATGLRYLPHMSENAAFWKNLPGLAWSNPGADDSTRIRAALLRPRFHRLLAIAGRFGVDRLRSEWQALSREPETSVDRARPVVIRILKHIEEGFAHADARR